MRSGAVFLSDFHMGDGGNLEDFFSESKFDALVKKLSDDYGDAKLDLVLLGDTFDLWQIVSPNEWSEDDPDNIPLELSVGDEVKKIHKIMQHDNHKALFKSLAGFLDNNKQRTVWFIPGNHDQSLVDEDVQQAVLSELQGLGVSANSIRFANFYDNPDLKVYAEHGSQQSLDNAYASFDTLSPHLKDQCPGYAFVRLFLNLLEGRDPDIESGPGDWYRIFAYIKKNKRWAQLGFALKLFYKYRRRCKRDGIQPIKLGKRARQFITSTGDPETELLLFPDALIESEGMDEDNYFSGYDELEEEFRSIYHATDEPGVAEFKAAIREIMEDKYSSFAEPGRPSAALASEDSAEDVGDGELVLLDGMTPVASLFGRTFDKDVSEKMYEELAKTIRSGCLDPDETLYVVMGHTHEPHDGEINGVPGGRFFNTGTWCTKVRPNGTQCVDLRYAEVRADDADNITAELVQL